MSLSGTQKVKVLLVDDDRKFLSQLGDFVTDCGYSIFSATHPDQAISLAKIHNPNIAIVDLKLPDMDGIELLRQLKALDQDIIVVIMTGYPTVESTVLSVREGAYDYLKKPINLSEIESVLKRASERHLLHKQVRDKKSSSPSILDEQSGVYSFNYLKETLKHEFSRAQRYPYTFSLLIAKIERTNQDNQKELLKKIGALFSSAVRSSDMVFRYSDDEFAVLCPYAVNLGAQEVAKRLVNLTKEVTQICASVKINEFPKDFTEAKVEKLLSEA